jgi:hypothetical protein
VVWEWEIHNFISVICILMFVNLTRERLVHSRWRLVRVEPDQKSQKQTFLKALLRTICNNS